MRLFETWTRTKVVDWIDHLEEQLALGATSIMNPDTGSISYDQRGAYRVLAALYRRLDVIDGKRPQRSRLTVIRPRIHPDS